MIHPSYKELMEKINDENAADGRPPITSRYSVVLATSKRARQITNGAAPLAEAKSSKALSIAVEEFYEGKVKMSYESEAKDDEILGPDEAEANADVQAFLEAEAAAENAEGTVEAADAAAEETENTED